MLQICQNIKQARVSTGLSQDDFAIKLGMERGTYKNWEYNTEPKISDIKRIAEAAGLPAYKLLEGVIEFSEEVPQPDVTIKSSITAEQYRSIQFSLGILEKVFGHGQGLKTSTARDPAKVLSGKRKPRASVKEKGGQRGT